MTVSKIYELGLIKDDTELFIRNRDFHLLARGNWYEDQIMDYVGKEVENFTWQDNNEVYVDLKILF